jgi:hypothetical protein
VNGRNIGVKREEDLLGEAGNLKIEFSKPSIEMT